MFCSAGAGPDWHYRFHGERNCAGINRQEQSSGLTITDRKPVTTHRCIFAAIHRGRRERHETGVWRGHGNAAQRSRAALRFAGDAFMTDTAAVCAVLGRA
jgi:hypothetical protein